MSTSTTPSPGPRTVIPFRPRARSAAPPSRRRRRRARAGTALGIAGCVLAILGVVPYCAASYARDPAADLGAIVFHGADPAALASLLVVGLGTILWIAGAVVHAEAALGSAADG